MTEADELAELDVVQMACLLEQVGQVVVAQRDSGGLHGCVRLAVSRVVLASRDGDSVGAYLGLGHPPGRSHPCTGLGPSDIVRDRPVRCLSPTGPAGTPESFRPDLGGSGSPVVVYRGGLQGARADLVFGLVFVAAHVVHLAQVRFEGAEHRPALSAGHQIDIRVLRGAAL
ncbi:hypothetical protein [Promicromonospora sukumoe]|uniref:Uncharacterized protein n=1 Tax=Promicromonospora sukumoe TaxID=88382 RepID=A0A7W3JAL6_9MICO|nr:hypothetical protein [Promicromonospora sukumoe]MBA8809254.1 hypothetical protein [Promicromonospora sukumoe]